MFTKHEIKSIDDETINRYNKRFEVFGIDAKTLGWGSKEHQHTRFKAATTYDNFTKKSVLDVGCGFSDFYQFLIDNNIETKKYIGIDINAKILNVAKNQFPKNDYKLKNILIENCKPNTVDIVTLFGLLNFKLERDNLAYTKNMICKAFQIARKSLIVDFLSAKRDYNYPKEPFVYYHKPNDILDICFELTNNVVLVHNYEPIPQKEFMVILKK